MAEVFGEGGTNPSTTAVTLVPDPEDLDKTNLATPQSDLERSTMPSIASSATNTKKEGGGAEEGAEITEETAATPEVRATKGIKFFLVVFSIYCSSLLYGLDTTVVADIQAAAVETFGEIEKLSWLGIGFPLGSVAIILPVGKANGMFSLKWLYIISMVLFEAGSALCGGAPNMDALIVGRVIAGAGGAGIYLGGLNIVSTLTTSNERPLYMSGFGVCWGIGTILGPVVGGAFADSGATWRWAFYINIVIAGVLGPIWLYFIPTLDPQLSKPLSQKLKDIDWLGSILNAGIYVVWVMGLTFGGAQWAWSDGRTIATFVVCGVLIILFSLQQRFAIFTTKEFRIFPCAFLEHLYPLLLFFTTACTATSLFICIYYTPLLFQFTRNDTALDAAVRLLPFIVLCITSIMANGMLMPKFGYYKPWFMASGAFLIIGGCLMYEIHATTPTSKIYGYNILAAVGTGLSSQAAYSVLSVKVAMDPKFGPAMVPEAIGFINTAQIGTIVHALAISGTLFQNLGFRYLKDALGGDGFTDEQIRNALAGTQSAILHGASESIRDAALNAIVKALDQVFILLIVAGAFCLVAAIFLKWEKLFMQISAGGA
ncbi:major facilitator superfamily domain-containing protein [Xylogone sp. PMI_703]|nr:major facilitator superfamily domain-containing protein [Xylogone sp. PMI_703]